MFQRHVISRIIAALLAASTSTAANAAIVIVRYTGITSTAEGAYVREQDFLKGTTTYTRGPVYDDQVSGSFTIDTSKLPAFDPYEYSFGQYVYQTEAPVPGFVGSTFASSGNPAAPTTAGDSLLSFPVSGPNYGMLMASKRTDTVVADAIDRGDGTSAVHREIGSDTFANALFWDNDLPLLQIDGVSVPDFGKIVGGAFTSAYIAHRFVADDVTADSPDGQILSRNVSRWSSHLDHAGGAITSISMEVQAVPEPSTWMMLIAGFGAVGVTLRRGSTAQRRAA
ncbi:MAG: PEPxxWA-CTERM sorting domain-containing protein [Sphingomonas phyllosphaerae]|uniref:PEPxxWA-CTERM sorting domain-containing protein n=1 Tax=Sphingomonas phyllosphaerae TaxID=257003 RepID=UPI002FF9A404